MKKDTLMNKQVVKAISLALAAVMTATPMTALAEEANVPNDDNNTNTDEQNTSEVANQAQAAVVVAKGAIDDALDSNNDANDANLNNANDDLDNTNTMLDAAEANDGLATGEANKANVEADKADDAADAATKIVEEADKVVEEQMDKLESATTVADANNAHAEIITAVEEAQADFDAKVGEYNTAKANAEAAKAKVDEYEKKYKEALANASANTDAAAADLVAAKAKAAELEAEAVAAKDKAESSAAYAIKQLEDKNNGTNTNWKSEDELFIAIMEKYFVPVVMGYEGAKVTRIQGKDNDSYNYFLVQYTDKDGVAQETYYNYKLEGNTKDIVIFEKREVEVSGNPNETPDQYRDGQNNKISIDELDKGLENGTFVKVDGTNYEKNDATDSKTLVESSEITGTSTEDITVSEEKTETYKLDGDGNLVKEVTAEVTTVTYTGASFESEEDYATDAERDAAAQAKLDELNAAEGKDISIDETDETVTVDTYTATGTYVPVFEKTIEINKTAHNWSGEDAVDEVKREVKEETKDNLDGYYIIEQTFSNMDENKIEDKFLQDNYRVTGTSTVTYAKTTKTQIDFNFLQGLVDIFTGDLEKIAKKWVENQGGIYVGSEWVNWNLETASVTYVAAQTITGEESASEEEAKASLQAAIQEALRNINAPADSKTVSYEENEKVVVDKGEKEVITYSYTINYYEEGTTTKSNQVVATETYANAEKLTGEIIQNLNYINRNIKLTQNDDSYRKFIQGAVDEVVAANELLTAAEKANGDVAIAQAKVNALKAEIEELKNNNASNLDVEALDAKLLAAEQELKDAEEKLVEVVDKLEDANEALTKRVAALTPAPSTGGSSSSTTVTPAVVMTEAEEVIVEELVEEPVATVTPVVVDEPEEEESLVVIDEEDVPLASGTAEETEGQSLVEIDDEDVPLVAMPTEEEKANMPWWWLLIIAVLGATGYKMYKDHQKKNEKVTK